MKKNMGITDRIFRLIVAAVFALLYTFQVVTGPWGIALVVVSAIFAVTAFVSFCPLYLPFGISTLKKK